jgi:transposase
LPEGLEAHDFHSLAKNEPHARTRIRFLGMTHLQAGWSTHDIATALGVHDTTMHSWALRFNTVGLDGLQESSRVAPNESYRRRKKPSSRTR